MCNMYKYFISSLLICCFASTLNGQDIEKTEEQNDSTKQFKINSFRLEVDVSPVVTSFLNRGETYNYEAAIQFEINNKFYPVFEMGYGGAEKSAASGIVYQGDALFYRLGMDFNLIKPKAGVVQKNNFFLVGGRLGFSHFNYDLFGVEITNNYWGTTDTQDMTKPSSNLWFEITAGVRVEIVKNVYIGWTVRSKNMLTQVKEGAYKAFHVPGFGIYGDGGVWGFSYLLGYKF